MIVEFCRTKDDARDRVRSLYGIRNWDGGDTKIDGYRVIALRGGYAVRSRVMVERYYESRNEVDAGKGKRLRNAVEEPYEMTVAHLIVDAVLAARVRPDPPIDGAD